MFGRGRVGRDGTQAEAVVVTADMTGSTNSHGERKYKLTLRVRGDDGTMFDARCSAYAVRPGVGSGYGPGDTVPVRYDADDRSKVEVDRDVLKAASDARRAAGEAGLVRLAEERLAAGDDAPPA